ncbi:APH(3'') family aminoglycoside O-phosphotransferase [Goodfellowiella coeruleoviolacea]|uniref:APH(3'') family aminoglycoside O-phosphotransferase n=1 Tax=Goodfellowiella coeruleoviolacea TaxID=334858 RepID=UPI0020A34908|nr:APH(3'') family aminoglycoside O-phosphotransferase [Goodfellowiella coeruleoviolacea]
MLPLLPPVAHPGRQWVPVPAGESGAAVWRRDDGGAFAKCVTAADVDALRGERDRVQWLAGTGVPGPAVLDWSASPRGACLVTTAVPGVAASELPSRALLAAWPSMVRVLRRLHALPVAHCPFERRLSSMFRLAEDVVGRGAVNPDFLTSQQRGVPPTTLLETLRAERAQRQAQEEADLVVCHGDACLPNFLVDPDTLECTGLIDLGRLGVADRHADLALLRANARQRWDGDDEARAEQILAEAYGADRIDAARLRFYLHLDPLTWS